VVPFLLRRLAASFLVLLVASYVVYVLTCFARNPLLDLIQSHQPNKATLIADRIALLNLDVSPFLRYFIWLGGILQGFVGHFSLGSTISGQPVTEALGQAMGSTLQLVTTAEILGIVVGLALGITTALRQYTAYDYTATFLSFLFFSLPIFWLAVLLKQYLAIGFNDFLEKPVIGPLTIAIIAVVAGIVWLGIIGGNLRRRITVFVIGAVVTGGILTYFTLSGWFRTPSLGPVVVIILGVGAAVLVTILTAGWENKRSRWTALTVVAVGAALYYPLQYTALLTSVANIWIILILGVVAIAVGIGVGLAWGGYDKWVSARTGGITAFIMGLFILLDRYIQAWHTYDDYENYRPIATIGSQSPDLVGADFWVTGLDSFSHLALPTVALVLVGIAGYSRYSRASLLDVMNQDYIRTARSKGLNDRTVVIRHAFRNALIPITTLVTLDIGALIGGAVLTETVFGWQGMGVLFQSSLTIGDVNPIMGVFLVTGIAAIVFNIVADLIYSALDPRIRVGV
jgi:peptide/nickel transport system permease protein